MTHPFSTPKPGMGSQTRNGYATPPVATDMYTPPATPRGDNSAIPRSNSTPILSSEKPKQTSLKDSFSSRRSKSYSHFPR